MSKKEESPKVKLLGVTREEGAYSVSEYEISHEHFLKFCKRVSRQEPDVFGVVEVQLIKKAREHLEI